LILPDVAGLRTWGGEDLTVMPPVAAIGKVYIRGQRWMGDRYDAILDPGQATHLWRNGQPLKALDAGQTWRAHKDGGSVIFEPVPASSVP
jgi:hypothetical protein